MRVIAIIPSRYGSTRLPAKPLLDICGKPMVQHVYEKACQTSIDTVLVATDDERIASAVRKFGGKVEMTSANCESGTDRLKELSERYPADIYVNIQGDEPLLNPESIDNMVAYLEKQLAEDVKAPKVATLCFPMSAQEANNPNIVKVVSDTKDKALYFSRSLIPFDRENKGQATYYGHVGIYAYSASALNIFGSLLVSPLEKVEKLEQLRLLQAGIPIYCVRTERLGPSVDTEDDLKIVRRIVAGYPAEEKKRCVNDVLPHIRCIITDVDGVLTDGGLYYGDSGEELKRFNVRDGQGIVLARKAGINLAILSGRDSQALRARLKDLEISTFRLGRDNKQEALEEICCELHVSPIQCLFLGDDEPDLPCFKVCGLGIAVADAHQKVKEEADLVLKSKGGEGALREIIDILRKV